MEWNRISKNNSAKRIEELKGEMEKLRTKGGGRDWGRWQGLKYELDEAYKEEKMYWSQKARFQWLEDGDINTQFFHASVIQRRKKTGWKVRKKKRGVHAIMRQKWWVKFHNTILNCSSQQTQ